MVGADKKKQRARDGVTRLPRGLLWETETGRLLYHTVDPAESHNNDSHHIVRILSPKTPRPMMMGTSSLFHKLVYVLLLSTLCRIHVVLASEDNADDPAAQGVQFLVDNQSQPNVITLPSGLQYKVITQGDGSYHPSVSSPCECHYEGKLIDGTVFDSSYERGSPTTFAPNQVIKGWTEAMQLMVEGDKWELFIPSDLAYGDRGSPPKIPGGSTLIFTMEILSIAGPPEDMVPAMKCDVQTKEKCNEKELKYLDKVAQWPGDKQTKEVTRLTSLMGESMKPELAQWVHRRLILLQNLGKVADAGEQDL